MFYSRYKVALVRLVFTGLVLILVLLFFGLTKSIDDYPEPNMPPPSEDRKQVYEAYKLAYLPDGYPGKMTDRGLVAHPIYGPHVIRDFLRLYENGGGEIYLEASERVAKAGLARMDNLSGALVFMYRAGNGISTKKDDHYSALTQAQWLYVLGMLWKITGDQYYLDSAEKVLLSLKIPVERGGVAKTLRDGIALEEWPSQVPSYILNGWTTAVLNIYWYSQLTGSKAAIDLFNQNIVPIERMLGLYDVESLANTRYQLTGFVYIRTNFNDKKLEVTDGSVIVPGEGEYKLDLKGKDRWRSHLNKPKGKRQLINVVLSRVPYPEMNKVELVFNNKSPAVVNLEIANGDYSPLSTSMPTKDWLDLGTYNLIEPNARLIIDIPWEKAELVAYPTNFKKKYGNELYNAYHFIHIMNLQKLAEITNSKDFYQYAKKWESYVENWPSMHVYNSHDINLTKYSALNVDK